MTRSWTTWAPGVEKDVASADSPWVNRPLPLRAQAKPVIGLLASVEVETSVTGSPVWGADGIHLNDATGGAGGATNAGVMTGGGVTVNVTDPLLPAGFPTSELAWMAIAVYWPTDSAGLASPEVQPAPVPVAVAVETTGPFAVGPAWIWTVIGVTSLAVPAKDGVVSSEGDWGEFNVTVGAAVSIVNVTGKLVPVSEAKLVCVACAV